MTIARKTAAGPATLSSKKTSRATGAIVVGHRVPTKRGANAIDARKKLALGTRRRGGST